MEKNIEKLILIYSLYIGGGGSLLLERYGAMTIKLI